MLRAAAAIMRAWSAIWSDQWNEAQAVCQRALELLGSANAVTAIHIELFIQQSMRAALEGEPVLADNSFAQLLAALEQGDGLGRAWRMSALHTLARRHWLQGHNDALRVTYQHMTVALHERIWPTDVILCREIGALVHLVNGHIEAAITDLRAVVDDQARLAIASLFGDPRLHLAHTYLQGQRPDQARIAAGSALAAIRREGAPGRLRWQGAAVVIPILRVCAAGGPHADFAEEMLGRLDNQRSQFSIQ